MTTDSGSSGGGSQKRTRFNPSTNSFETVNSDGSFMNVTQYANTDRGNVVALPTSRAEAPRGASLGQSTRTGRSLVSTGNGGAREVGATAVPTGSGRSGGGGPVGTTVNAPTPTVQTPVGGRTDSSPVLAGQSQRRPDRSPSRSTNFASIVGGAGGLGRRSETSKRTLIGGA